MRFLIFAMLLSAQNITTADDTVTSAAVRKVIPDRLVILTFDDSAKSHYTVVRQILKEYEFGATAAARIARRRCCVRRSEPLFPRIRPRESSCLAKERGTSTLPRRGLSYGSGPLADSAS